MSDNFDQFCRSYGQRLQDAFAGGPGSAIEQLADALHDALLQNRQVFLAGNGGSAANAIHLVNDFLYGTGREAGLGMRAEALSANASVLTCLANDISYSDVFAEQLRIKGSAGDLLIVLSGSGNSPNVVKAIDMAHQRGMKTFAVLGYAGGRCLQTVQVPIHFKVDDMQIAEDLQLMVGHICMQWIRTRLAASTGRRE